LLFAGLPALAIILALTAFEPEWAELNIFIVLGTLLAVTLIPLGLSIAFRVFGGYVVYPIYALAIVTASPAWFIKFANKMGNGKGVSGIGLILAFHGVLGPAISS
jgi:hypothetical protein